MKFILATKVGMTRIFGEDGHAHAGTILTADPIVVTQVKTKEGKDAYAAIQVGQGSRKTKNISKPVLGHTKGKGFQGVTVTYGENFLVAFDYNPEMKERLQKIADVTFDKDANAFVVPSHLRDNLVRAVSDMRRDFVADNQERAQLISLAETKMDGARVGNAFTKDGLAHYGKVVDVSDRYVLQHGGKNEFKLHRRDALDHKDVQKDQSLKITYEKGRGKVEDRNKERDKDGLAR